MKYIDSEKITAKIDEIIDGLKRNCNPDPMGTTEECLAAAEIEALELVKCAIDEMKQEEPTPPGIEEERKKERLASASRLSRRNLNYSKDELAEQFKEDIKL